MANHIFKLPTGIECEVKEFTGKHQRLLTESSKGKTHSDRLIELLTDIIVRVGSVTDITDKFIRDMLACDTKKALVEARQFTLDFETEFVFTYKYTDSEGSKQELEMVIPINEGTFPFKPVQIIDEDGKLSDAAYTEYSDVIKDVDIILPKSQSRLTFTHLDGNGEKIGVAVKKEHRSSHTILSMRAPKTYFKADKDKNETPMKANLDTMAFKDIEHLRKEIKRREGTVDTEIMFDHPEAETKSADEKEIIVDLISTVAFFFPSEAI